MPAPALGLLVFAVLLAISAMLIGTATDWGMGLLIAALVLAVLAAIAAFRGRV